MKYSYLANVMLIFGSTYAMENLEQKSPKESLSQKQIKKPIKPSPGIERVRTVEDIITDPNAQDEFKCVRRRSRSLESISNFESILAMQSSKVVIAELILNNSIKKYRSLSSEQLKSSSKQQLPDLSLLTIKE